jgi:hypothetical protein
MTGKTYAIIVLGCVIVLVTWLIVRYRYLGAARQTRLALTTDKQYRALADEYRRLSDLAITAQEHTDLRLSAIGVQIDELSNQVSQLQHILKEVE